MSGELVVYVKNKIREKGKKKKKKRRKINKNEEEKKKPPIVKDTSSLGACRFRFRSEKDSFFFSVSL